ncbi:exodeoxyribonuclease V subunit beta [Pseudomonas sp. N040]|uniref:exodeoxyribonuclease V subunit beta n=1 Tax=Pseudomonas sp. N040 TaxID=2785325 RepID=UPI0018A2F6A3|nr:exodeoxyribonuclease V subunit beta [Pseudomonas sp. N040]MBF7730736.1 exodeoxyribonuclease V subunit beta [Pseudomonas sp. N040]MBW7014379.1 exodeoxyribonuclease V subunit beta [Pseudomonas sp. N040]
MMPVDLQPLSFPLHGSRLIEASAGTGKTFTIALLYVRLVLGHGGANAFAQPLNPPQILVVTFTDAATQELRERIRLRLSEAAQCFLAPQQVHDGLLEALRADYPPEQWPACARRLQLAGEWMDEAAVSTIHGWCYRMLREHAFDSGSLFTQTLETDQSELLAEIVRDYWRRHCYVLAEAEAAVVAEYFSGPQALNQALAALLTRRDARYRQGEAELAAPTALEALLRQASAWNAEAVALEQAARSAWHAARPEVEELLRGMRGKLNGTSYRGARDDAVFLGWLEALAQWSTGQPAPKNLARFGQTRFKLNGGAQAEAHAAFQAIDALFDHQALKQDIRAPLLLHALQEVRARFDAEKLRRAEIGFDDLLNRLDAALQGPAAKRLAQTIRTQYPVALIDEFQDTDPLQYRIFQSIYRIEENCADSGLFLIGDPKQAIYSFRGADIFTYLRARQATGERHYTLATNYRSTRAMVAASNRCFAFAEQHPRGAFRFAAPDAANPLPFHAVGARGRDCSLEIAGQPQPALTFWNLPGSELINKQTYQRAMAQAAASAIQAWLDPHGAAPSGLRNARGELQALRPADIAILVRNRNEAEVIRQALAQRQLASVYLSDRDSVFDSEEARDLLYILRACAQPAVDRLLRAALATRSIGLGWPELERLNHDELHWEQQVLRFREYRAVWQQQGVLPMLRKLLAEFRVPARLLQESGGERSLTNLLHLAEWLQRSATELDGENALIRHLAEQVQAPGEEEILRLESDADLIKVVTVHKSKGLEYPLVLLPFVCSAREIDGNSSTPPMYHAADDGQLFIDLARSEAGGPARDKANDERLSEEMRLLYVALTRARYATWLGMGPVGNTRSKDKTDLAKSGLGYLLAGGAEISCGGIAPLLQQLAEGCPDIISQPAPAVTAACYQPAQQAALGQALQPQHQPPANWWIASYSALLLADSAQPALPDSHAMAEPASAVEANLKEEAETSAALAAALPGGADIHAFPRGAGPGTFLHGLFEWAGKQGFALVADNPALLASTIARRCNLRDWEGWIEPLCAWLTAYLQTPLHFAGHSVSLAGLHTYQVEMEFWFASQTVSIQRLDQLVRQYCLPGAARPALVHGQLNGMFKGFIDLTFEHQGRYYVADYKSNWLGTGAEAYEPAAMAAAMLGHRYDLQLCLYVLALHRQLQVRLPGYDYDRHMGGGLYLFIRGQQSASQGLFFDKPPRALIEQLDALFTGQANLSQPRETSA